MSSKDQYLKFFITFHSVVLNDCPQRFQGKQCLLKYVRGRNELETKKSAIDKGGLAEFNERIEMKTFLEFDDSRQRYKEKLSKLFAVLIDGGEKKNLGWCQVDLADFAQPIQHQKQVLLTNDLMDGVNPKSHIQLMVDTSTAKEGGSNNRQSQIQGSAPSPQKTQAKPQSSSTKNDKLLKVYQGQIDELSQTIGQKKTENDSIMKELQKSDMFQSITAGGEENIESKLDELFKQGRNNDAKYAKIQEQVPGTTKQDIQQLKKLDREIDKLFEKQFKMTNKNEEMLTNKLNELDDRTVLRDYLFKQVGNKQLQNDINTVKEFVKKNACTI